MINWKKKDTDPNIGSEALQETLREHGISRRNFLAGMITSLIAAILLIAATFSPSSFLSSAQAQSPSPSPKVDVHCHIFNAKDVPLVGVLKHFLKDTPLAPATTGAAIALANQYVLSATPGYVDENEELNELLLAGPQNFQCPTLINTGLIQAQNWLNLFKQYRFQIACELVTTYSGIDLFTPAMLDFDYWLPDNEKAETTIAEQIILYEKIVRLFEGKIHPLVAFNPMKEVHYREDIPDYQPLKWVKEAVEERGFIGVKLYPPMGFYPINNSQRITDPFDPSHEYRGKIDEVLESLYDWCIDKDVPIMVHCADSNESQQGFGERANPLYWKDVLSIPKYSNLRLNLGHFGHDVKDANYGPGWPPPTGWAWYIAKEIMKGPNYPNVYADTGYHVDFLPPMWLQPTGDPDVDDFILFLSLLFNLDYIDGLDVLYNDTIYLDGNVKQRLMYGSDSHVLMVHPWHEYYANRFGELFDIYWPNLKDNFLGLNALRFFGLDDPGNKNWQRLLAFYEKHNMTERPSWWVGGWWMDPASAPTTPTNLSAVMPISSTQINLSWSASTGGVGATEYKIYRDGVEIGTSAATSYQDSTGLSASITYTYNVFAIDAAGNVSKQSSPVLVTTP